MKHWLSWAAFTLGVAIAAEGYAAILPKDVLAVKNSFDKVGATSCSTALAETVNFIAKGRPFTDNKQWSTADTNKKTISIDFLITGDTDTYSKAGSIVLTPVSNKCVGTYVYSWVTPAKNCKEYIQKGGYDGEAWNQDLEDFNGDGGKSYFLSVKKNASLNFIFNDVAGGCSVTKRETMALDMPN